jgi:hypothetical protein
MRGRKTRWALTATVVGVLVFAAVGGPAAAKHFIDGADIKPGTIEGTQLADGAIGSSKLSRRLRRSFAGRSGRSGRAGAAGRNGANGGTGPAGPQGPAGARGAAGGLNVLDATGKPLGLLTGWFNSTYYEIYTAEGALLIYDPSSATDTPIPLAPPVLYYRSTDCSGTPYGSYGPYPLESAIMLGSPARPGTPIYVLQAGVPQSFTFESVKSASPGCTMSRSSTSSLLKPFQLASAG